MTIWRWEEFSRCDKFSTTPELKVKVEVTFSTCYSASYMRQTRGQKRFDNLGSGSVVADWHELMIPQRTMRPSIARVNAQLDSRFAASRHTTALISHTRPSPRKLVSYYSFSVPRRVEG